SPQCVLFDLAADLWIADKKIQIYESSPPCSGGHPLLLFDLDSPTSSFAFCQPPEVECCISSCRPLLPAILSETDVLKHWFSMTSSLEPSVSSYFLGRCYASFCGHQSRSSAEFVGPRHRSILHSPNRRCFSGSSHFFSQSQPVLPAVLLE